MLHRSTTLGSILEVYASTDKGIVRFVSEGLKTMARGGWSCVMILWHQITQPSIVLGVKACLAARNVAHCSDEKVCKGSGMLWYGLYIWFFRGVKVDLVQPFHWDHEMTDDAWPISFEQWLMFAQNYGRSMGVWGHAPKNCWKIILWGWLWKQFRLTVYFNMQCKLLSNHLLECS